MKMFLLSVMLLATSCTVNYNISMAHSQGTATDMIDDVATNTPTNDVSPTVSIPAAAL